MLSKRVFTAIAVLALASVNIIEGQVNIFGPRRGPVARMNKVSASSLNKAYNESEQVIWEKKVIDLYNKINKDVVPKKSRVRRAVPETTLLYACVGYADNPWRMKVYFDQYDCGVHGWTHFYGLMDFKEYDAEYSSDAYCIGDAFNPHRSYLYVGESNCSKRGWTHLGTLYSKKCGVHRKNCKDVNKMMRSYVYRHSDETRMLMSPVSLRDVDKSGFARIATIPHALIHCRLSPGQLRRIAEHMGTHPKIYKREAQAQSISRAGHRAIIALMSLWAANRLSDLHTGQFITSSQLSGGQLQRARADGYYDILVQTVISIGQSYTATDGIIYTPIYVDQLGRALTLALPSFFNIGADAIRGYVLETLRSGIREAAVPVPIADPGEQLLETLFDGLVTITGGVIAFFGILVGD